MAAGSLHTRAATPQDTAALAALYAQATAGAEWLPPLHRASADFAADTRGEHITVCTDEAGAIQGFVSVWLEAQEDAFIHHLYVHPARQRCGVGRALLTALDAWLPRPWQLKCVSANTQALAFYRALGWQTVGDVADATPPCLLLRLGPPGARAAESTPMPTTAHRP